MSKAQSSSKDDVIIQLENVLKLAPNYQITVACRLALKEIKALRKKIK